MIAQNIGRHQPPIMRGFRIAWFSGAAESKKPERSESPIKGLAKSGFWVQADAGPVVRCADEFNALVFEGASDGVKYPSIPRRDPILELEPTNGSCSDFCRFRKFFSGPAYKRSRCSNLKAT